MARKIKFKIWDKELNYFLDGDAHFSNEICFIIDEWTRGNWTPARFIVDDRSRNRYTLVQFTGLKDKNGQEIYEGDIIGHIYSNGLKTAIFGFVEFGSLEYESGACEYLGYYLNDFGDKCWITPRNNQIDDMVIGNIYENPELLEAR